MAMRRNGVKVFSRRERIIRRGFGPQVLGVRLQERRVGDDLEIEGSHCKPPEAVYLMPEARLLMTNRRGFEFGGAVGSSVGGAVIYFRL